MNPHLREHIFAATYIFSISAIGYLRIKYNNGQSNTKLGTKINKHPQLK